MADERPTDQLFYGHGEVRTYHEELRGYFEVHPGCLAPDVRLLLLVVAEEICARLGSCRERQEAIMSLRRALWATEDGIRIHGKPLVIPR